MYSCINAKAISFELWETQASDDEIQLMFSFVFFFPSKNLKAEMLICLIN